jgi:hypothetical protein
MSAMPMKVLSIFFKKSLKIPKRSSESVDRRTDNTMAKGKRTKGKTTIYKSIHLNIKIK